MRRRPSAALGVLAALLAAAIGADAPVDAGAGAVYSKDSEAVAPGSAGEPQRAEVEGWSADSVGAAAGVVEPRLAAPPLLAAPPFPGGVTGAGGDGGGGAEGEGGAGGDSAAGLRVVVGGDGDVAAGGGEGGAAADAGGGGETLVSVATVAGMVPGNSTGGAIWAGLGMGASGGNRGAEVAAAAANAAGVAGADDDHRLPAAADWGLGLGSGSPGPRAPADWPAAAPGPGAARRAVAAGAATAAAGGEQGGTVAAAAAVAPGGGVGAVIEAIVPGYTAVAGGNGAQAAVSGAPSVGGDPRVGDVRVTVAPVLSCDEGECLRLGTDLLEAVEGASCRALLSTGRCPKACATALAEVTGHEAWPGCAVSCRKDVVEGAAERWADLCEQHAETLLDQGKDVVKKIVGHNTGSGGFGVGVAVQVAVCLVVVAAALAVGYSRGSNAAVREFRAQRRMRSAHNSAKGGSRHTPHLPV